MSTLGAIVFVALSGVCLAVDMNITGGGITTKVQGQSGKITVCRDGDMNCIVVAPDALREVNTENEKVGKTGNMKHSIESFASQDFTFDDQMDNVSVPNSNDTVRATTITFTATLSTGATLSFVLYIVTEVTGDDGMGYIVQGDETQMVEVGTMKFNVMLNDYVWCDPCNDGMGSDVVFVLEVKGKNAAPTKMGNRTGPGGKTVPQRYDLGGGQTLDLSNRFYADSVLTTLSTEPVCSTKGIKYSCEFKFPKGNGTVNFTYDPTMDLNGNMPMTTPTSGVTMATVSVMTLLAAFFVSST